MSESFEKTICTMFQEGKYTDILYELGKDLSNSPVFKKSGFADFNPGKHDIIVSTYPKSGTTWMMQLAYQVAFLGEGDFDHQYDVVCWPDKLIPIDNNIQLDDMKVARASPLGMRVIKSHLEADYVPYSEEAKYISVIRDPKDMLVSMSLFENGFNRALFDSEIPVDSWVESFVSDRFMYQPWAEFIDSWWSLQERDNVLVVTFEEMKTDIEGVIRKVAKLLGVTLQSGQLEKVVNKTSFSYMKNNQQKFAQPANDRVKVPLVRSGQSGNSAELLSTSQMEQIDTWCLEGLQRIRSSFPYREKFKLA